MSVLPASRILKGATGATLSWQPVDSDGEPADPGGTVTVAVTRADGTTVTVGAVQGATTAARTVTVAAAQLTSVDWLTAVWSVDAVVMAETLTEVAGGTIGSLAELGLSQPTLNGESTPNKLQARREVEDMFTDALHRAPFPRFFVERVSGHGRDRLVVTWPDLRRVLWCRLYDGDGSSYTALTAGELSAIVEAAPNSAVMVRTDGQVWPCGRLNVEIAYEHGIDAPGDLRRMMHHAVRAQVTGNKTGISDRAMSYQPPEGGNVTLATPGLSIWVTGIPGIDETIKRYKHTRIGIA